MDFMVVLGSDDGLIASGERTFISGSPRPCRCVLSAVLGHLDVPQFVDGIPVAMLSPSCEHHVCVL